jgi:predicted esterase
MGNLGFMTRLVFSLVVLSLAPGAARGQGALDSAFAKFWSADDLSGRQKAAREILRLDASFAALQAKLRAGRSHAAKPKTGLIEESRKGTTDLRHEYVFMVPEDYDPSKAYRVAFYLHGGVSRQEPWKKGEPWWRRFDRFQGVDQISVFPSSWRGSLWWQSSQIENLAAILQRLKSRYNVDENRVYLFGVSDGGTGAYYHAFKAPTIWAAFFVFLGNPGVLENPATGVDGLRFLPNLVNRPFFIVNAEKDELYPVNRVRPYIEDIQKAGVELVFRIEPGGHNTRWWNSAQPEIDAFMESHVRKPLPDRLIWETERTDRFARLHWLVIEQLKPGAVSGRVELVREGNHIEVKTTGVSGYRLLLSADQFDFAQPINVVTNGAPSFRGSVEPSRETLLEWAARDDDRSTLFGAELAIVVP